MLSAANTYTGLTTVSGGTLAYGIANAISSGGVTIESGGALDIRTFSDTVGAVTLTNGSIVGTTGTLTGASYAVSSGTISAILAGTGGLTKSTAGTVTLSGANTYTGVTTVSAGVLRATTSANALGANATATALTLSGGNLELAADSGLNFGRNTTVSTSGTIFSERLNAGAGVTHTLGTLAIGAQTLSVATDASVTSGTAGLTFGNVTQTGASTFDVATGARLNLGALQSGTSITKTGVGILALSASSSRTTGTTTLNGGTLLLSNTAALGTAAAPLVLTSGTLDLATDTTVNAYTTTVNGNVSIESDRATAGAGITQTLGTLSIGGNTLSITRGVNATSGTGVVQFGAVTLSGAPTFDPGANARLELGALGDGGTGRTIVKSGAGILTLSSSATSLSANTVFDVNAGTLHVTNAFATGTNATIDVADGATFNLGASQTIAALTNAGSTLNSGAVVIGNGLALTVSNSSANTFSGVVSGSGGLTKGNTGLLTLSGNNTYTGATTISAGTVSAASIVVTNGTSNLGNATSAVVLGDASNRGTLSYTGTSATFTRGFTVNAGGGRLDVTTAGQTLTVGTGNITGNGLFTVGGAGNVTVSSTLAQSSGLVKTGAGILTLSSSNTYNGATSIEQGTLVAEQIVVTANASSLGNATSAVTLGGASTSGTLSYTGASATFTRGFTLGSAGGRLNVTAPGTTLTIATGGVSGDGSLTFSGSGSAIATSALTQAGGLTMASTGTLALSGVNTFGPVAINTGVVRATTNAQALGAGAVTLGGGNLELANDTGLNFGRDLTVASSGTIFSERLTAGAGVTHTLGSLAIGSQTLALATDASVTSGTAGLAFTGAILTGNATFAVDTGAALTFTGAMTGSFGITKTGAGVLTLADSSGHTNTTVSAGRLNVNARAALGTATGTLSMAAGTTLGNTSGTPLILINSKSISLGSSLTFAGPFDLNLASGTTTLSAATTTIDVAAGTLTFDGNIVGSGLGITKTGTGTLAFAGLGAGSYTGNTLISQGRLFLDGASVFSGGTSTIVTVQNGAFLEIGPSASLGGVTLDTWPGGLITTAVVDSPVVFTTSGTLNSDAARFNGTQTISSGVIVSSTANYFGTIPATAVSDRIVVAASGTLGALSNFNISPNQGVLLQSGTATFNVVGSGSLAPRLFLESVVSGSGTLRKTGGGNLRLLGINSYTGGTIIEQGIIGISSDAALGSGGLQIIGSEFVGAYTASGSATDVTVNASRSITIGNGTTSAISAQTGNRLAYAGTITEIVGGGAAGNLRVGLAGARAGTVVLGGANTYRGSTTLAAGTLEVAVLANGGVASGIGQSSNAAANLVLQDGSRLRFTGANASTDRLFTLGAGGATLDSGSGTLAFTNSGVAALAGTGARTFTLAGSGSAHLATILADLNTANKTSLTKTGVGTWELTSAQQFTGPTSLQGGTLLVNGSLASNVLTSADTTLGGAGLIAGTVSGAGMVSPGNSPGIMTAGAFDPTGGLDASFEFTQFDPNYGSPTNSGNDVLRLTDGSPFVANLGGDNVVDVYFNVDSLQYNQAFTGGFFTNQQPSELLAAVQNAQFQFWFRTTGSGQRTFNGFNYNPLSYEYSEFSGARVQTREVTTNFGGGEVAGAVTEYVIVPEPGSIMLAGFGLLALLGHNRLRRLRRTDSTGSLRVPAR